MYAPQPINILLVDDNETDIILTEEAFASARVANRIYSVRDGLEALAFLHREAPYSHVPTPDVVLLDINMPRMNGLELLQVLRGDERLTHIPVVMLTTSQAEEDVFRSYRLHANAYIAKPIGFAGFLEAMQTFEDFWFAVVRLPRASAPL